ncbi:cytoskeleton-associated protein 4-like [Acipenser oxyrinchus oxyrinchus]|uniref:Cytoskeleton-associated protein 4-like n=1 Tax=Acipenser oxyrinchus oxyrinchus TaxID=40147 RepID=A0AAD8DH34_ACIOX|nr:cytoskeleton-associated protein 4-like [Acipenser oxyrinchus oxyrinchus]
MSSVKQRIKNNAQERASHSSSNDVAKKSSKGSKGGSTNTGSGILGKVFTIVLYLALISAAVFAGYYLQIVMEHVSEINSRNEESTAQATELVKRVESALEQVDSLKLTVRNFDISLKDTNKELESTNKAVRKGETETHRIEEVLHKLQNEILQDLSNGIRDVREARERDFSSLEQTLEERLTELTKSINDNVSVFTEVQRVTQNELQTIKSKIDAVDDLGLLKHELLAITTAVADLSTATAVKEEAIESLKNQISSLQSEVQTRNQEVASTVQEFEELQETVQRTGSSLRELISEAETSIKFVSGEVQVLHEGLQQVKASVSEQEQNLLAMAMSEEKTESLESRLKAVEENTETLIVSANEQSDSIESIFSKYDAHTSSLSTLERDIKSIKSSASKSVDFDLQSAVQKATEAQESFISDIEMLKNNLSELQIAAQTAEITQNEILSLDKSQKQQIQEHEQRLAEVEDNLKTQTTGEGDQSVQTSINDLKSSFSQAQNDLRMLRTAVDSLVAYSVKIETNEKELVSLKNLMDEMKSAMDTLSRELESVQGRI